jgi:hypothetical protein
MIVGQAWHERATAKGQPAQRLGFAAALLQWRGIASAIADIFFS